MNATHILVGEGSCGIASGAKKVVQSLQKFLEKHEVLMKIYPTGCLGNCYLEPIVDIYCKNELLARYVRVRPEDAEEIVKSFFPDGKIVERLRISKEDENFLNNQTRVVMMRMGLINPENIKDFVAWGGYEAARAVFLQKTPEEVVEIVKKSGLRGRGGAGFPTWYKWNAAKSEKNLTKYVICNADEGDPGAFMDRAVLEGDPHALIEGMLIAGYAIGAEKGIIYVRAEYPLAIQRLEIAIQQARNCNFLGKHLFDTGISFDIEIRAGAGAFVCGEETALIASLEGERGQPRLKPPFPAQRGFWGRPTNINNVETLACVPWIFQNGAQKFTEIGTSGSPGTKVFALAGKIKRGGLAEVSMGVPISHLMEKIGGGSRDYVPLKGVQMGGPSGGCIPASLWDTPVDYENIPKTGAIMGSGGMIVMDETTCIVDMARYFLEFTQEESCGKCSFCRIGTRRMLEILEKISQGLGNLGDLDRLEKISNRVREGSLCGLGQTAPNPVLSALRHFREEFEEHVVEKKCRAHHCKALIKFSISEKCKRCGLCGRACPASAISGNKKTRYLIDEKKCIKCGKCWEVCRFSAVDKE